MLQWISSNVWVKGNVYLKQWSVGCSVTSDSLWPHGLWSSMFLSSQNSLGKNTWVGSHLLLQGIFLTQGSNSHLLCLLQADSLPTEPSGKARLNQFTLLPSVQMMDMSQWTCVWASSGRWWRTGKPGMLQSMGSKRVRHDWATERQHQYRKVPEGPPAIQPWSRLG